MKAMLTAMVVIAIGVLFATPGRSSAQGAASDTMYVSPTGPNGPNLFEAITGDTTSTGARKDPNRVYVLQVNGPVDTVYFLDNTITMTQPYNLTIVGKLNPQTGHPPVIEPIENADKTTPDPFIMCDTGNVTLKGLYILGMRPDGVMQTSTLINEVANYTTFRLDHCVIDGFSASNNNLLQHHALYNSLFITNCEFRNITSPDWPKGAIYWQLTKGPIDTLWYVNNTFFCVQGSYFGSGWDAEYIRFDNNTCFLGSGPPLKVNQPMNEEIKNNIFYGLVAHAGDSSQANNSQFGGKVDNPNIVVVDTLGTLAAAPFNLTEAQRIVTVTNNAYCWPQALMNFWHSYNDTTHDPLILPVFMNKTTLGLFADKNTWPHLYQANNDSLDPGFSSSLTTPALDSLIKYVYLWWSQGNAGGFNWQQLPTDPSHLFAGVPSDWQTTRGYPVPENLTYSNTQMMTMSSSGQPLGDLNWYHVALAVNQPNQSVPSSFSLSNNYPNPFNPSTDIKVSLKQAGVMSLTVYNVLGQVVDIVAQGYKPAGEYTYNVNMDRFASGVYFYTLRQGANEITKKMLLLK